MPWTPGRPAPSPAPLAPERTIWRVQKDVRAAEARVRLMGHGHELRIVVSHPERPETLAWSCLYRPHESEELRVASAGTLADFQRLGWTLDASDQLPQ